MMKVQKTYWPHRLSRFLKHTTPRRWENWVLAHTQHRLGVARARGLPPLMYIDPVNYCNLHCPQCPTGQGILGREKGRMPFELFQGLVDEVADRLYFLNLYNWGEPLLHPQIFDMVEYAAGKGLSVRISSNLNRMTPEQAVLMVDAGLEELLVDLDGATQEAYEAYRVGGDLQVVIENLRKIVDIRRQRKSRFPLITARVLVTRHNQAQLRQIETLAWSLGADRLWTAPIYVNLNRPDEISEWVPESALRERKQEQTSTRRPDTPQKCRDLWLNLTVSWDGGVFPCCWFHKQEHDFGHVPRGESLTAVWKSERFIQSRRFIAGKSQTPPDTFCAQCRGYPEYYYPYC